jgi:hypothetical protein
MTTTCWSMKIGDLALKDLSLKSFMRKSHWLKNLNVSRARYTRLQVQHARSPIWRVEVPNECVGHSTHSIISRFVSHLCPAKEALKGSFSFFPRNY